MTRGFRRRLRSLILIGLTPLPSSLKVLVLRGAFGFRLGKGVHIGFSVLMVDRMEMGDHAYIGNLNVFKSLDRLDMGTGSRIGRGNVISSDFGLGAALRLGEYSSISTDHYLDVQADVVIGNNVVVGGRNSTFFTHSLSPRLPPSQDHVGAISIGDWCYIGSDVGILPGVRIPDHCFVGMGAVVASSPSHAYRVIAGNPAEERSPLDERSPYFSVPHLVHGHDPRT